MSKTVIVTGASRGIGRAISLYYAKKGFNVCVCCHKNADMLDALKDEIENIGADCMTYVGNISIFENAAEFFSLIKERFGKADILINNAGISYIGLLQDMTPSDWNDIVTSNLTSVFNCCKLAIPIMLGSHEGKIINISSVWGCVGASTEVAYSATKGGINTFTKALAKELAPSNIQVNAVACGIIDTDMNSFLDADELAAVIDEVPAGRIGTPEDVAKAVYDISATSSYMTGQIIRLDGGWI